MAQFDVLVTAADQRQGLVVTRALGSMGLRVFAVGAEPNSLGFYSRYTAGHSVCPSPLKDEAGFVEGLLKILEENQVAVLLPAVESTVIAVDAARSRFEALTRVALPPSDG